VQVCAWTGECPLAEGCTNKCVPRLGDGGEKLYSAFSLEVIGATRCEMFGMMIKQLTSLSSDDGLFAARKLKVESVQHSVCISFDQISQSPSQHTVITHAWQTGPSDLQETVERAVKVAMQQVRQVLTEISHPWASTSTKPVKISDVSAGTSLGPQSRKLLQSPLRPVRLPCLLQCGEAGHPCKYPASRLHASRLHASFLQGIRSSTDPIWY
jgi:hypothetical protein